ncbi:MAG: hypothetical protein M0Z37_02755 [Nitrospiraceae bacterium]|nr:hypothetical protein [Nitrospiraceae bacterium]
MGQNVREYGDKLLIKPSRNNVKAFLGKVRDILKESRALTQQAVIGLLNPIIRGWPIITDILLPNVSSDGWMPKSGKGCGRGRDIVIPTREKSGPKTGISSKMEREFSLLRLTTHPSGDMSKSGRTHTP